MRYLEEPTYHVSLTRPDKVCGFRSLADLRFKGSFLMSRLEVKRVSPGPCRV